MVGKGLFVILVIIGVTSRCYGKGHGGDHDIMMCRRVIKEELLCMDKPETVVNLNCPSTHQVSVQGAKLFQSSDPQLKGRCPLKPPPPLADGSQCMVADLSGELAEACSTDPFPTPRTSSSCSFTKKLAEISGISSSDPQFSSKPYLVVKYTCDPPFDYQESRPNPDISWAMQIDRDFTYEGSKVHLDSHMNWALGKNPDGSNRLSFRSMIDRGCCIHVPPHTEMITYPYVFLKVPPPPPDKVCDQRLLITEMKSGDFTYACGNTTKPTFYECKEEPQNFFVEYYSKKEGVGSIFVLNAQVSDGVKFTVKCGVRAEECRKGGPGPTPTGPSSPGTGSTPNPTGGTPTGPSPTGPKPTGPKPPKEGERDWLPIILGCGLAALLLLILIMACIACRGRGGSEDKVYIVEDESNNSYLNMIALPDTDQASQLTLMKTQDPANVLYVNNPTYSESYVRTLPGQMSISGI